MKAFLEILLKIIQAIFGGGDKGGNTNTSSGGGSNTSSGGGSSSNRPTSGKPPVNDKPKPQPDPITEPDPVNESKPDPIDTSKPEPEKPSVGNSNTNSNTSNNTNTNSNSNASANVSNNDPTHLNVKVVRYSSGKHDTLGKMFINDQFYCYTLEDEKRDVKVKGETRIPAGTYDIKLRTVGGFHATYATRYKDMHKGMLWLQNVPGFEYILIHTGNNDADTMGCVLVGMNPHQEKKTEKRRAVWSSKKAYKQVYPIIANHLVAGGTASITMVDEG